MKKNIAILAALGVVTLTACGSKTDANEKNFSAAMNQHFEESDDLCLDVGLPVELTDMALRQQSMAAKQMAALEAVGMAKGEDIEEERERTFMGEPTGTKFKAKFKRYTLTDAAKPFVQEKEVQLNVFTSETQKLGYLCWGKKALDKVVKWEGPASIGGYQKAHVTYTYKVNNLATWARKPEVQAAFPDVKITLDRAGSREYGHTLNLTNRGWED